MKPTSLIDTVTVTDCGIVRLDGTVIEPCDAIDADARPIRTRTVVHDGWVWSAELFSDGSERLYATGPHGETSWLDCYPVAAHELVSDIEGLPAEVARRFEEGLTV